MRVQLCAFADEAGSSLQTQINALVRNNIELIELRNVDGVNVEHFTIEQAQNINEQLKANGIRVWSIGSPIGKSDINEDFQITMDKLAKLCDFCDIFGCCRIRIFSFYMQADECRKYRDATIFRLRTMVEYASKRNIFLCLENEQNIYGYNIDNILDLLNNVSGLEYVFDGANYIHTGDDIDLAIDSLAKKANYIHIKDALYADNSHTPAGLGDAKIDKLLSRVTKPVVATVEPHLKVFGGYNNIDKRTLKVKYDYATQDQSFDAAVQATKKLIEIYNN